MTDDRVRELLSNLMDILAERFDVDAAMEIFQQAGFLEEEMLEMGYGDDDISL